VLGGASLTAPPPPAEQLRGLTFQTTPAASATEAAPEARPMPFEAMLSLGLVAVVAVIWWYFS
jgi:hypothetical protein